MEEEDKMQEEGENMEEEDTISSLCITCKAYV
jgi:hypothetical protein